MLIIIQGFDFNPSLACNNSNLSNFHQEQFNGFYFQYYVKQKLKNIYKLKIFHRKAI